MHGFNDGPERPPATYTPAVWVFLRALALIYFIAFISLWTQVIGLIGENGILPAQQFLDHAGGVLGPSKYRLIPTLLWLGAGDTMLHLICGAGAVLSLALLFGIAPAPVLFLLWALYLSLCAAGQDFMLFQWDVLLLETGFLAMFLAPPLSRHTMASRYSSIALWMLRWLLFRLMFSSGIVKLLSGDGAWPSLTALQYHNETQPLPTWVGWYVHQLPDWFQAVSVAMMFAIEMGTPFLIFTPAKIRRLAFFPLVGLQLLIALTGNYCFFNLLSIALCLTVLDDQAFPKRWRPESAPQGPPSHFWSRWIAVPVLGFVFLLSVLRFALTLRAPIEWPQSVIAVYRATTPFRSVNGYGLFSVMTTRRLEIVVEGSSDGVQWRPYEFKYKPGDLARRPAFVAPHQPRLDWQMWFAALGTYQENRWFIFFCERLLAGEPSVVSLLQKNPFPDRPPAYLRSWLFQYHFSDMKTRRATGQWWNRQKITEYSPVFPEAETPE